MSFNVLKKLSSKANLVCDKPRSYFEICIYELNSYNYQKFTVLLSTLPNSHIFNRQGELNVVLNVFDGDLPNLV